MSQQTATRNATGSASSGVVLAMFVAETAGANCHVLSILDVIGVTLIGVDVSGRVRATGHPFRQAPLQVEVNNRDVVSFIRCNSRQILRNRRLARPAFRSGYEQLDRSS